MLRLDQIDLDDIVRGRDDDHSGSTSWWIAPETGAVVRVSHGEPDDVVGGKQRRWEIIHPRFGAGPYRDMADFVDRIPGGRTREVLDRAISGRGPSVDVCEAARRFTDNLVELPEVRQAWFAFRDARGRRDALRWLAKRGYVDPAEAEAAGQAHPDPPMPLLGRRIDADAIARSVVADLRKLYGERLQHVVLFGSYARGTADEESDIDLLVVLDEVASVYDELAAMDDVFWRHSFENDVTVSAVAVSEARYLAAATPFLSNVAGEGRLVS